MSMFRQLWRAIIASMLLALGGGLLASLPVVSFIAMFWIHAESKDPSKVAALSVSIFWLVLPSLVFFLVLPAFLLKHFGRSREGSLPDISAGKLDSHAPHSNWGKKAKTSSKMQSPISTVVRGAASTICAFSIADFA